MTEEKTKDIRLLVRLKNNQLLSRRENLGMTVKAMADLIGISYNQYCKFENLKLNPVSERTGIWTGPARKVAMYFDASPEVLWPDWVRQLKSVEMVREVDWEDAQHLLMGDYTQRRALHPYEVAESFQLKEQIERALGTLEERDRDFLVRAFGIGVPQETEAEIARAEGLSRSRVNQIIGRAVRYLRLPIPRQLLVPYHTAMRG